MQAGIVRGTLILVSRRFCTVFNKHESMSHNFLNYTKNEGWKKPRT